MKAVLGNHIVAQSDDIQFYDLVLDGRRHERAAWSYEKPQPKMQHVGGRFGFWHDVTVS
jgi:uncharacterized protein (DUF427 family)